MNLKKIFIRSVLACCCTLYLTVCRAQSELDSIVAQHKTSTDDLYYDAVKARITGDDKTSEKLLKEVIDAKPDEPAPYYDLSRLALKANDPEKAAEYIKKAVALDEKNKWYREQYASALTLRNDYLGAAEQYTKLAKTEKYNDRYLERAAWLYQRAGKYKEALDAMETLRKKSNDDEVLLQEQQLYLKMNDVEGAARIVRELISRNPKDARFYGMLIEIYENNKQPEKAKEAMEEMAKKFPSHPSLFMAQASQALKAGDTVKYLDYVRKIVLNKEHDAETRSGLLANYFPIQELFRDSVQRQAAISISEQAVTQHPDNVGLLSYYGYVLSINGQREQAAAQFKKAVSLKKDEFVLWRQLLDSYTDRQSADSLIKWSEKAARLFPNQALVHFMNGVGYSNKKEYPKAIKAISRAIDLQPEDKPEELSVMYTTLGDIYNSTKEYILSDSSYNAALRLDPRNATVLNNYAYYLSVRNTRLSDAAKMSEASLKIRPGEPTFLDTYAWILYQQGKYKDALSYIQKAINANTANTDPTLWEHLGAIQYKLGNTDAAVEAWRKAKERGTENMSIDKMIADRRLYE